MTSTDSLTGNAATRTQLGAGQLEAGCPIVGVSLFFSVAGILCCVLRASERVVWPRGQFFCDNNPMARTARGPQTSTAHFYLLIVYGNKKNMSVVAQTELFVVVVADCGAPRFVIADRKG